MFISIIASSLVFGLAGACWRYIVSKQAVKHEPEVQKTVSIDDCTKVHKNALDTVMEILDTTNDDATVNFISAVVNNAIVEKQQLKEERISIRRLVEKSVRLVLDLRKPKIYAKWKQYVEDHNTIPFLSSVIAKNFIANDPLKDIEIDDIDSKELEKGGIFENMLHSYSSKGLTATDLQSMVMARKRRKINIQVKVEQYLETHKGSGEPIGRKHILKYFGYSESAQAWAYILKNKEELEKRFDVNITKRASAHKMEKGNDVEMPYTFVVRSGTKETGTKYFYAQATIRKSGATTVKKGSMARVELSPSFDNKDPKTGESRRDYTALRNRLLAEGILKKDGECLIFTCDYEFSSTSIAGTMVCGARKSGHTCWSDRDTGKTLKDILDESISV